MRAVLDKLSTMTSLTSNLVKDICLSLGYLVQDNLGKGYLLVSANTIRKREQ